MTSTASGRHSLPGRDCNIEMWLEFMSITHTLMTLDHGVESLTNSAVVHLTAVETAIIFKS